MQGIHPVDDIIYHDHFIGEPGGVAIFYVDNMESRDALLNQKRLAGWRVEYQPLIFSYGPSAFDEQIAFTLKAYRGLGNPAKGKTPFLWGPET